MIPQDHLLLYYTEPGQSTLTFHCGADPLLPTKWEIMDDVVGNIKSEYNPCDHKKLVGKLNPLTYLVRGDESGYTTYSFSLGGIPPPPLLDVLNQVAFLSEQYLDDFSAQAEDSFRTVVDDNSSFINLLLELITMCEGNIRALQRMSERFIQAWESFFQMLKATGSYWVSWNFAIKPLIRDVKNLLEVTANARRHLRWLKKHNHKPVKVRFRGHKEEIDEIIPVGDLSWIHNDPDFPLEVLPIHPSNSVGFFAEIAGTAQANAWGHVKFDIADYLLDDMILAMGMIIMTMQGIYNPLKIIWEAVPFSWLIEWFVNKRTELLKELASLDPFGQADILATGYSISVKILGTLYYEQSLPNQRYDIGGFQYKRFYRSPGLPKGGSSIWTGGLTPGQLGILAGIALNWDRRR